MRVQVPKQRKGGFADGDDLAAHSTCQPVFVATDTIATSENRFKISHAALANRHIVQVLLSHGIYTVGKVWASLKLFPKLF